MGDYLKLSCCFCRNPDCRRFQEIQYWPESPKREQNLALDLTVQLESEVAVFSVLQNVAGRERICLNNF